MLFTLLRFGELFSYFPTSPFVPYTVNIIYLQSDDSAFEKLKFLYEKILKDRLNNYDILPWKLHYQLVRKNDPPTTSYQLKKKNICKLKQALTE